MRISLIDYSFIRLKTTKEQAFDLGESPITQNSYIGQVQLLPKDPFPYIQTTSFTSNYFGFDSDFTAFLVDCYGNEEDITSNFITNVGLASNSVHQLSFRLAYLPTDYGQRLLYLKVIATTGSESVTFYSNRFKVTRENDHLTSRIDYSRFENLEFPPVISSFFPTEYNSIRLAFYLNDYIDKDEVSTYLMISNGEHINSSTIHTDLIEWIFEGIDYFTNRRLKRALQKGRCYINGIANQSTESIEYEGRYDLSNASTTKFITDQDEGDTYEEQQIIISQGGVNDAWVFLDNTSFTNINDQELSFL